MAKRSQRAAQKPPAAPTARQLRHRRGEEERLRRILYVFGGVLGIAVILLAAGAIQQYYLKPRQPIAVVNGTAITPDDYRRRILFEKFRTEQRFGPLAASGSFAQQIQQYLATQLPQQVFETMITDEILRQEAQRQNISISDADVTKSIQDEFAYFPNGTPTPTSGPPTPTLAPTATLPPGTAVPTVGPTTTPSVVTEDQFKQDYNQFLTDLKQQTGLDENFYRERKKAELMYNRFREQAIAAASIPATTLQVRARQIVVDTEDDAKKVADRLKAGESFEAVAKAVSKDTATKDQGGDLDYFAQGDKDPQLEKAAFSQAVNAIGDPFKINDQWYILQVTEAPTQRPISQTDRQSREQQAFDTFLSNLQSQATIERNFRDDVIPSEITNPPTPVRPTSTPRGPAPTLTPRPPAATATAAK
ncbi:MAG: SurA N-terminal domain-containing protein [Anaerolineae bacterium]|nr:SurA N-terminal domain-containing protein [Anaerolineae bacterium]